MAPARKPRNVNKRITSKQNTGNSRQCKKELSDRLGPQWSRVELERFYEAYRKHGQEWIKVAGAIGNSRSVDMVEALFNINRAYLSLPEGTASVAGLIAMMTDRYSSVMEGSKSSDSEGDSHDASEIPRKKKKHKRSKHQLSDSREEGDIQHSIASKDGCLRFLREAQGTQQRATGKRTGKRTPRFPVQTSDMTDDREAPKKKDIELTSQDEFDVLQTLAEMQEWAEFTKLPATFMESESSAELKEERTDYDIDDKSSTPEATPKSNHGEKTNAEADDYNAVPTGKLQLQPTSNSLRRKHKSKVIGDEAPTYSSQNKFMNKKDENNMKSLVKAKGDGQDPAQSKQLTTVNMLEESTTGDQKSYMMDVVAPTKQDSDMGSASISQKPPNRRKMSLKKILKDRAKSSETIHKTSCSSGSTSVSEQELLLKDKLSTLLLNPLARRRCIFEWFYSAIDLPWFAKMEFVGYLNHLGLGDIPRLTRLEWSFIISSLGRPRRFSERFLQGEREELEQYRMSVRKHYAELQTGARRGLPTELAQPISVGNRVISILPKTLEIHDGKILSVDHNKYIVQFDGLGLGLVMDIDCMPSNPLKCMPKGLRQQIDKRLSVKKEEQPSVNSKLGVPVISPPCRIEDARVSMDPPMSQGDIFAPILHRKVSTNTSSPHSYVRTYSKTRVAAQIRRALALRKEMLEIVKGSKIRARAMVDAAIKEGKETNKMIQEAQMPSELITSCVATLLMIQICTERQYPPAVVAKLIEIAVASLQPRCPQNLPIYREIQTCMRQIEVCIKYQVPT